MLRPRFRHRPGRGERARLRVVNFRGTKGAGSVPPPRQQHPAVGEQRRRVAAARRGHGTGERKGLGHRIVQFGGIEEIVTDGLAALGIVAAAGDQNLAIRQRRGGVAPPRHAHSPDGDEFPADRVVPFRGVDEGAVETAGDEDVPVLESGQRGVLAGHAHLDAEERKPARDRFEDLGGAQVGAVVSPGDENRTVGKDNGRGVAPRGHHAFDRGEGPGGREVHFRVLHVVVVVSPGDQHVAVGQPNGHVALPGHVQSARRLREDAGVRIVQVRTPVIDVGIGIHGGEHPFLRMGPGSRKQKKQQ